MPGPRRSGTAAKYGRLRRSSQRRNGGEVPLARCQETRPWRPASKRSATLAAETSRDLRRHIVFFSTLDGALDLHPSCLGDVAIRKQNIALVPEYIRLD